MDRFTDYWNDHKAVEKFKKVQLPFIESLLLSDDYSNASLSGAASSTTTSHFYRMMSSILPNLKMIQISCIEKNRLNFLKNGDIFMRWEVEREGECCLQFRLVDDD